MNSRMYDPVIGRVLSPDAYVQAPGYTQSYNRYSYCMNNPLRYTDPSGWQMAALSEFWNLGAENDCYISFSGRRAGDNTNFGGGWGGNGGVVPEGAFGNWASWAVNQYTTDDVIGSLWNATSSDGYETYSNVNGDWYNTYSSTVTFDNQGNGISGGDPVSAVGDDESIFNISIRGYGMSYKTINLAPFPAQGRRGITFPSFSTLDLNYPHDVNGVHQHPSSNPSYRNQCAIRMSECLIKSGVSLTGYPIDDLDEDYGKWALTANRLKYYLSQNNSNFVKMSQPDFQNSKYWNQTGIIYIAPPPGGVGHIDIFSGNGITGSGYYLGSQIWFWPIQ